tara:strand:- start:27 stop:1373 length:1347 start_codon:yes stop_codon:yes gene_type:complete
MGIPSYYKNLIIQYKNIKKDINNINIDKLFIDYNGLIHPIAHKTLCDNLSEKIFYNKLWEKTLEIIDKIKAKKVYLFVDGVAPLAKIIQQRKRRYMSDKKNWDTNAITSGTPFMNKLLLFLEEKCFESNIYLNGSNINGEGEHKILSYINDNNLINDNIVIHGLDADLILLSLLSKCNNIYLMRDNNNDLTYISINNLKNSIYLEWKKIFNKDSDIIKSYVVLITLLGNDFLPNLLFINLYNDGINILKKVSYNINIIDKNDENKINIESINIILKNLIEYEKNKIKTNFNINSINDWNKNYYNKINLTNINLACKLYLDGIFWTYNYYNKKINLIDHSWYYPFNGVPTILDLYNYSILYEYKPINELNNFINYNEQLLIVIPKKSIDVIPDNIKKFMIENKYGLIYLFPSTFKYITFLKDKEWQYIPILPLININYIKKILSQNSIY